jgi:hypothetical protein
MRLRNMSEQETRQELDSFWRKSRLQAVGERLERIEKLILKVRSGLILSDCNRGKILRGRYLKLKEAHSANQKVYFEVLNEDKV